jgi:hypothetical protein
MRDPKVSTLGTGAVVIHAVLATTHYMGHSELDIEMTSGENAFINVVILTAPVLAGVILWTRLVRLALSLLIISMAGALLFGVYHHYFAISPDHVVNVPPSAMRPVFHVTAFLLPLSQAFSLGVGVWALRRLQGRRGSASS